VADGAGGDICTVRCLIADATDAAGDEAAEEEALGTAAAEAYDEPDEDKEGEPCCQEIQKKLGEGDWHEAYREGLGFRVRMPIWVRVLSVSGLKRIC
jgi:hypothetical protein